MARLDKQKKKRAHEALMALERAEAEVRAKKLAKYHEREARREAPVDEKMKVVKVNETRRQYRDRKKRITRERQAPRIETDVKFTDDNVRKVKKLNIKK